jgi:hypothetical protein
MKRNKSKHRQEARRQPAKRRASRPRKQKQSRRRSPERRPQRAPRTAKEFFARPRQFQEQWSRLLEGVSKMREGLSLRAAAQEVGLSPDVLRRLAGPAIRKGANRRYAVTSHDRLLRVLVIPTADGMQEIAVRDSRVASRVAEYWNAVHRYLGRGDVAALAAFEGITITDGRGLVVLLLTDRATLDRLANAGVLSFESIYARSA